MTNALYGIIVLFATIIGAITGLGGGVIIKPLFDLVARDSATVIGLYSAMAVFTMSIVSITKQKRNGFRFDKKTVGYVSLGSIFGGLVGEGIFDFCTKSLSNNYVKVIQNALLLITLVFIIVYGINQKKVVSKELRNPFVIFLVGLILGLVSVFMGIGGGPLNVAMFMILFSFFMKESTVYSIVTIFFAQLSKLMLNFISGTYSLIDWRSTIVIVIVAIVGGYIGTLINQRLSNKIVNNIYNVLMIALSFVAVLNIYQAL
ncbi:sulfite exporter TauE/SafE family protein [Companilactobacillus kimchii]|uniref:Probable membrane transporter protein n=2 Tax=Companilactobacillus kimchii TaxID=2801452 RepID=A0ABR5NR70_9LACO|nr:sulfite exporter TauE/SafE family protein [Companilactobacillus kimchii]KAE9557448.1 hypothetical protein ATN91_04700 [Companilactobacillus kimchii]KRK50181.1 hypothetical protein FC97_GL001910 [Companilactobacillus kimchii DSM 13961 = JCM 10707]OWF32174.1 hypothetical protein LKACC12383_02199 [Companilactobacillus kimchii]GEO48342.1 UPF0721 transmembrane protein [Companilactobacillus paralimentarius]